eukprot:CAMPEP_0195297662 /NCGR_PEP_ID=MMETSP0707-20130614/21964_1 /TAXON_ID=33640 /ORGANISM="Asterionellopsis glacialis, Strain CCMP134" /LENGTH=403 /DNA_ID=CAMNT_0040359545 /DNA_START=3 /DNA_END=1214 /DNA_ORIENTATION=-
MANQVRDKTLVLRVLVPSLETRLRDKIRETEEQATKTARSSKTPSSSMYQNQSHHHNNDAQNSTNKETLLDLDGVTCEPIKDGSTLWNFHCDGANYPARLVNLPCPIELHKTHDHAMYYKSADVAQILIVYEDQMAMEEAEVAQGYKVEGFPSYYNSGITPPLKNVVERRFHAREHKAVPPPSAEVSAVEQELKEFIDRLTMTSGKGSGGKGSKSKQNHQTPAQQTKVLEEVVDEVVEYEAWMDNYVTKNAGSMMGFTLEEKDSYAHPELWLDPSEIAKINKAESERNAEKKKKAEHKKKVKEDKKKKSKEEKEAKAIAKAAAKAAAAEAAEAEAAAAAEAAAKAGGSTKKGIASKKSSAVEMDEVTQAAAQMNQGINDDDALDMFEDMFDFSNNEDDFTALM